MKDFYFFKEKKMKNDKKKIKNGFFINYKN
jgi:hypothetical protein